MFFSSDRHFKVWDYNVSHKQLLIRSPTTPDIAGNVDIVFWQVCHLNVPTSMYGVKLSLANDIDKRTTSFESLKDQTSKAYFIDTKDGQYFVIAGGFKVLANDLDISESTLVDFGVDHDPEWYGKVIAHS